MEILQQASQLLRPLMDEERSNTRLTLAFHGEHRDIYDAIDQRGATKDFSVRCVRQLLDHGRAGSRHALSLLLEVARPDAGDEKQAAFADIIRTLDARCERPPTPTAPTATCALFARKTSRSSSAATHSPTNSSPPSAASASSLSSAPRAAASRRWFRLG